MRKIPVFTFGTYYAPGCQTAGANAWDMRWLCWWAKNDPGKVNRVQNVLHPNYPQRMWKRIDSPEAAYDYTATLIQHNIGWVRHALQLGQDPVAFVPVPSSTIVESNWQTGRWSGREISQRLEQRGVGTHWPFVVNKVPTKKKTEGGEYTWQELRDNYTITYDFPAERIVYIDDILTHGGHLAALDAVLGKPAGASAICIASTDTRTRDSYEPQARTVKIMNYGQRYGGELVTLEDGCSY